MIRWICLGAVLVGCGPPQVPGLHTADEYPQGCVDCHHPNPGKEDFRILQKLERSLTGDGHSSRWLAAAEASAPPGVQITGVHPDVSATTNEIPTDCLACHAKESTVAPPFAQLMHLYHLRLEGEPNPWYFKKYDGWCTHCHALDDQTGRWRVKTGPPHPRGPRSP